MKYNAIFHYRLHSLEADGVYTMLLGRGNKDCAPNGGLTLAFIIYPKDTYPKGCINIGASVCDIQDSFVKKTGVNKSLGRALSKNSVMISDIPYHTVKKLSDKIAYYWFSEWIRGREGLHLSDKLVSKLLNQINEEPKDE